MMETFELAERHSKFDAKLWHKVSQQEPELVLNKATPEARRLYSLHRQVGGDYQRCRAFSRLKISEHGIVYGKINPEHKTEDMVAEWFLSRFPLFVIVLESKRGTYIMSKENGIFITHEKIIDVIPKLEKKFPKNKLLSDLTEFDENLWENVYDSNYIAQRKNTKLFLKNMPKKYYHLGSLALEKKKFMKCRNLNDFL